MKKLLSLIIALITIIVLVGCNPEDSNVNVIDDELQLQIESLNKEISNLQQASDDLQKELDETKVELDEAQVELDEANALIDLTQAESLEASRKLEYQNYRIIDLQRRLDENSDLTGFLMDQLNKLYEDLGIDARLILRIQSQKSMFLNMANDMVSTSNVVSPFEIDDEWLYKYARYYSLLEEIVFQGYVEGTTVNIDEFTLQHPLDYYITNASTNNEHFIKMNYDDFGTLFSQVLFYDGKPIEDAKVIKAINVEDIASGLSRSLHIRTVTQTFDENQVTNGIDLEDYIEGVGVVKVSYNDAEDILNMDYKVGFNVRMVVPEEGAIFKEGTNVLLQYEYSKYDRIHTSQTLQYFSGYDVTDTVYFSNNYSGYIAEMNTAQEYLNTGALSMGKRSLVLDMFNNRGSDDILYDYEEFHDHRDIFTVEEGNTLGINFEELEPLYNIYLKMFEFLDLTDEIKVLEEDESDENSAIIVDKKAELNQIGNELLSYEYKGDLYRFVNYDEETSTYSLREHVWDEEDLVYYDTFDGGIVTKFEGDLITLAINEYTTNINTLIGGTIKTQYEELLNFNASLTYKDNGDIDPDSMIPFINKMKLVGALASKFETLNSDILMIKNENRIVLNQDYVDTKDMDNYLLINNIPIEESNIPNQDIYLLDYQGTTSQETYFLELFPKTYSTNEEKSYYSMTEEELINYLLSFGLLYQAPIIGNDDITE